MLQRGARAARHNARQSAEAASRVSGVAKTLHADGEQSCRASADSNDHEQLNSIKFYHKS